MVFLSQKDFITEEGDISIAISGCGAEQCHVGLVCHDEVKSLSGVRDKPVFLLHLWWNNELKCVNFPHDSFCYIASRIDLPKRASKSIVSIISSALESYDFSSFKYGSSTEGIPVCFSDKAVYDPSKSDGGLTCSTFVVALLWGVGVKLIKFDEWPKDPDGNLKWMKEKYDTLIFTEHPSQAEEFKRKYAGVHIKAEEVAAAAASDSMLHPLSYAQAVDRSPLVIDFLKTICNRP